MYGDALGAGPPVPVVLGPSPFSEYDRGNGLLFTRYVSTRFGSVSEKIRHLGLERLEEHQSGFCFWVKVASVQARRVID